MGHYKIAICISLNRNQMAMNLAKSRLDGKSPKYSAHIPAAALLAAALFCPLAGAAAVNTPEISEKQADLGELRSRIDSLRKELSASEGNQADAADRLRASEREISRLQRELHELSGQRGQLRKQLGSLQQQQRELATTQAQQQAQLEKLLYKQYLRGNPDSLQLLFNGSNPNQMARDLHYLSAIALTRAELMGEISATLERKKTLANAAKEHSNELAEIEGEQQKRHDDLQKQREERQALYARISDKVRNQRKEIGNLQQDEQRLSRLINRLSSLLASQAAQAAQAAQSAARTAEQARATEASRAAEAVRQKEKVSRSENEPRPAAKPMEPLPPSKPVETENRHEPTAVSGNFALQKGNLRLPVRGNLSGRFGSPREGGGTWRGLFIRASNGNEVKAIAGGRVVFSDWMRGFGNLLIIDHGNAYLSIYGNNESLLKQVGQAVRGGETVATVGNSGGNPDSGLYFELRHQGQPIDPMKWASLK